MPSRPSRLLALRAAAKLLAFVVAAAVMYLFFTAIFPPQRAEGPGLIILTGDLPPGELRHLQWGSRRIMALHRTPEMVSALEQANDSLEDSDSGSSMQPEAARNRFRSLDRRFFIALDYDPEFGCPLELAPSGTTAPVTPWRGGFRDVCRGSWYDLAGHVYKGQPSGRNLMVPPYTIDGDRITIKNQE